MNEFIKERFSYLADNKKENAPELNVSYGIDKNFLYGAGVSISSVLINNSDINFVFHVFTDYVDDDYLKSFNETAKQFNTSIIVYLIDPKYFADLPTSQFWSYATYFRVLSFEYLSESISTLLYLDADVVCKGSLKPLTKIIFKDEFAAVIPDNDSTQAACAKRLNIPEMNGRYFNAGVIYVNLKKWHEANLTPYLLTLLRGETKYGSLKYLDQDALNIAFNMNNIYLAKDFDTIYTLKNELHDRSHRKYQQTITDKTVLIHYTGITKPWHSWAGYPSASYFNIAREQSPWKKYPLKEARTVAFPNDFYFLAERKIFNYASVFIMLIEYVEGVELNDMPIIPENVKAEIKASMEKLHALNMLSGDPHRGNFIVSKDGVRIIDLSGKSCTAERKARDRLAMERHLGIVNEIKDYGYYSVIYRTKLRKFIKKLKGKA